MQWTRLSSCLILLALGTGCRQAPEAPAVGPIESEALGLAVATLPAPFALEANDADGLTFSAGAGTLEIRLGPEEPYINLEDEVARRKDAFKSSPGGIYDGTVQLVLPLGLAYTARGSYTEGEGRVEELWAFFVHPRRERLVSIVYRYPAGEGRERAQQLTELLGELEELEGEPAPPPPAPAGGD